MEIPPELLRMVPYRPGKPIAETKREFGVTEVYKLASNENPYGPSPLAVQAMSQYLGDMNLYADPSFYDLLSVVEKKHYLPRTMLSVGNGSNEIIDLLIRIFARAGEKILTTEYAFVAYQVCAEAARVQTLFAPIDSEMKASMVGLHQILKQDTRHQIKVVFIPNPNNPTGTLVPSAEVEDFVREWQVRKDLLIVVDEAYHEYVRDSAYYSLIPKVSTYPNLAVLRTFSKAFGLAGLRVGLIFSAPSVIDVYNRVRIPFNVNELGQVGAAAALHDDPHVEKSKTLTWKELDKITAQLRTLQIPFVPTQGNFILFDTLRDASAVHLSLLKRGVILRPVANYGLPTCLRLSIGTEKENQIAMNSLREVLQNIPQTRTDSVFSRSSS